VSERDVASVIVVEPVPREHRSRLGVELRDHKALLIGLWRSEPPLGVAEHAQPARRLATVRQPQQRHLDGIGSVHEDVEFVLDARNGAMERRDAGRVRDGGCAARRGAADRTRCRRPHFTGVLIADINRFGGRVDDRIVRKRRQPVLAAVLRPGER
jgi:hypothetical protein